MAHDLNDPSLQIRSGTPRDARQRRLQTKGTPRENALRIFLGLRALLDAPFVACTLALFAHLQSHPIDSRMKPEQSMYERVNRRNQVVAATNVFKFMCQDCLDLQIVEFF